MQMNFAPHCPWTSTRNGLAAPVSVTGTALHAGGVVEMTLKPGLPGSGRVFVRTDMDNAQVPARFDLVGETRLGTFLNVGEARVGMIEHLMAALTGAGVDDVEIALAGAEPPVLDGCSEGYLKLIDKAGVVATDIPREVWQLTRTVRVGDDKAWAELSPAEDFSLAFVLEYPDAVIGHQDFSLTYSAAAFRSELAPARTFGFARELDALHEMGLARGAGLENTLAFGDSGALNPGGLRFPNECVRHKLLDVVGDLSLAGAPFLAHFTGVKSGHTLNNALLRAVFSDPENVRKVALE